MDYDKIIANQNANCEPFARAKAFDAGDIKYDAILSAKKEALLANVAAFSAVSNIILISEKKKVAPRNAVSMMYAFYKSQKAAKEALKLSGPEYYIMSPASFHANNKRAIDLVNKSTKYMKFVCAEFETALKLDEDSTNDGISSYIASKHAGSSDNAAHNAACNAKFKSRNFIVRWINRTFLPKNYWKSKVENARI